MAVFIDLGGTKTIVKFQNKKDLEKFLNKFKKEELKIDKKENFVEILTYYIKEKRKFFSFLSMLKEFGNIYLIFPEPIYKNKIFSKKFDFLNGKDIDSLFDYGVVEVLQDIKALTFYSAEKFFSNSKNREKLLTNIILGTGINYLTLDYYIYENSLFLEKLYEGGHSTFEYNGKMCHCGREGCVERYLAGNYLFQELKVENLSSISHITSKKLEFHKRLAYFLSSILISHGTDKFFIYGGLGNIIDKRLLIDFIKGTLPFGIDLEFDLEINDDPLLQIKGMEIFLEKRGITIKKDSKNKERKKLKKNNSKKRKSKH